jgi:hypothetical protein
LRVVVVRRRDRLAHALALVHDAIRRAPNFNASLTLDVRADDLIEALDAVQRDNALLDWFASVLVGAHSCALELELDDFVSSPDTWIARLFEHFGANPAQRLDDAATNASAALRAAFRGRRALLDATSNAIGLLRRIRNDFNSKTI